MKLNLTFVKRAERTSKAGKPFTSLSIKTTQYGERYLSGFGNKANENWKEGDEVEVAEVVQKGEYLNFEMPKHTPNNSSVEVMAVSHKLDLISSQLRSVIDHLSGKNRLDLTSAGTKVPDFTPATMNIPDDGLDQINPEEIPF